MWHHLNDCIAHVCLCAFAGETVMLSYSMWYNIRQVPNLIISLGKPKIQDPDRLAVILGHQAVPCPLSPEDCQWPTDFTELLDMRFVSFSSDNGDSGHDGDGLSLIVVTELLNRPGIGEPASWEGRVCTRWFQGGQYVIFMLVVDIMSTLIVSSASITAQIEKLLSGFGITVDIEDESSGTWMPIPPDSSHSLAQSG